MASGAHGRADRNITGVSVPLAVLFLLSFGIVASVPEEQKSLQQQPQQEVRHSSFVIIYHLAVHISNLNDAGDSAACKLL